MRNHFNAYASMQVSVPFRGFFGITEFEPAHEIANNVVCATSKSLRSACAYAQSDQSLC